MISQADRDQIGAGQKRRPDFRVGNRAVPEKPNTGTVPMLQLQTVEMKNVAPSPLMLCDRLLTLAQDADRAGCAITAEHLLQLAYTVFEEKRLPA
jgi:hypothetical protein